MHLGQITDSIRAIVTEILVAFTSTSGALVTCQSENVIVVIAGIVLGLGTTTPTQTNNVSGLANMCRQALGYHFPSE